MFTNQCICVAQLTKRLHLDQLREKGQVIPIDGVGGTMILVKSYVHQLGALFPALAYKKAIETEGFAVMAKDMGFGVYAMPSLEISHM